MAWKMLFGPFQQIRALLLNERRYSHRKLILSFKSSPSWHGKTILAATCDFQQCGVLTSVDSDEPVQPPFKLRKSK